LNNVQKYGDFKDLFFEFFLPNGKKSPQKEKRKEKTTDCGIPLLPCFCACQTLCYIVKG
jgi:hypothetical protein